MDKRRVTKTGRRSRRISIDLNEDLGDILDKLMNETGLNGTNIIRAAMELFDIYSLGRHKKHRLVQRKGKLKKGEKECILKGAHFISE